jgi:SagB-type dehydrogenase family enzyme
VTPPGDATSSLRADEVELRHQLQSLVDERDAAPLVSELYHENSKQIRSDVGFYRRIEYFNSSELGLELVKRAAKQYACADRVALPPSDDTVPMPLQEAIARRRSVRHFGGRPFSLQEVATLSRFANGIPEPSDGAPVARRAVPSGGALYPTELYVLPLDVVGLEQGAYHYDVLRHELARFVDLPAEPALGRACYLGKALPTASVAFAISACFERQSVKYAERAYRFTLLECGHLAQNLLLMATAMELEALPVGGFMDDDLHEYLQLDGRREAVLYLILMGSPVEV